MTRQVILSKGNNKRITHKKNCKIIKIIKRSILKILIYFNFFPHIYFTFNPFKIYEFKEVIKGINFSKDELVLDFGCGNGLKTLIIGKKCKKIIGVDVSKKAIKSARYKYQYTKGKINCEFFCKKIKDAKFKEEYFDKIFSICVLEHVSDYSNVMGEIYRILKKGGQLIFSVDSLENIRNIRIIKKHKKQYFVKKYFKKNELKKILEQIGFIRIEINPIFKSNFAKRVFIKEVNNRVRYNPLYSI